MDFNLCNFIMIRHRTLFWLLVTILLSMTVSCSCRPSMTDNRRRELDSTTAGYNNNAPTTEETSQERDGYGDIHPEEYRHIKVCNRDDSLMELCMRCSKVTKSKMVYPMCCGNEDHVRKWCEEYVYYGIPGY